RRTRRCRRSRIRRDSRRAARPRRAIVGNLPAPSLARARASPPPRRAQYWVARAWYYPRSETPRDWRAQRAPRRLARRSSAGHRRADPLEERERGADSLVLRDAVALELDPNETVVAELHHDRHRERVVDRRLVSLGIETVGLRAHSLRERHHVAD